MSLIQHLSPMLGWRGVLLAALVDYVYCSRQPVRGDVWLLCHIAEAIGILVWSPEHSVLSAMVTVLAQIMIFCTLFAAHRLSPFHPLYRFPGPIINKISSLPALLIVFRGKRYEEIRDLHAHYGTFVRTGPNNVSINDQASVEPIYTSASAWEKSQAYKLGREPDHGLFFLRGKDAHHVRRRQYWAPAFTGQALASYAPMIERCTDHLLDTVLQRSKAAGGQVDISRALQQWSHDVTGHFIFGDTYQMDLLRDDDPSNVVEIALRLAQIFEILGESQTLFDVLSHLPTTQVIRKSLDEGVQAIKRRRTTTSPSIDLMRYLLNEDNHKLDPLSDDVISQDVNVAIAAGTNGISSAISFALFYLNQNPSCLKRLRLEIQSAFPSHDGSGALDGAILASLPYLTAVVEESMRLGAPLGTFARVTPKDGAVLAGKLIPEGTIVSVPSWTQNISEENFRPEPCAFRPERWLPGGLGPDSFVNRHAVMTFSHGPWGCMGKQIAIYEMRLVLAKTLLRFDFCFSDGFDSQLFLQGVKNMRVTEFTVPLKISIAER